jgi:hypothetical protein
MSIYPGDNDNKQEWLRKYYAQKARNHAHWAANQAQPQLFEVGRLASPMWHKYRELHKEYIKAGVKKKLTKSGKQRPANTVWESKWVRPEAHRMSTKEFLHLGNYKNKDIDDFKSGPVPTDLDGNRLIGPRERPYTSYIGETTLWAVLKHDFAKVMHANRHVGVDRCMALIQPSTSAMIWDGADARSDAENDAEFETAAGLHEWRGKKPNRFSRVFMPICIHDHWFLIVLNFREREMQVYDSIHQKYPEVTGPIQRFLEYLGCKDSITRIRYKRTPTQRDYWNCGMYTIMICHRLFRGKGLSNKWNTKDTLEDRQRVVDLIGAKREKKYQKYKRVYTQDEFHGFNKLPKGWLDP